MRRNLMSLAWHQEPTRPTPAILSPASPSVKFETIPLSSPPSYQADAPPPTYQPKSKYWEHYRGRWCE
ncbi:hypothetical protein BGZ63DRAFT_395296 [Mariannaea sp. PMI_226]|nr:hypothetical protein BGZ63DRAFT_395296 [Mariannaea sp. PMI_226]